MKQPMLSTERLTLIPLADAHIEFEFELDSDPEVMRYVAGRANSRSEVEHSHTRRRHAAQEAPGLGFWVGFAEDVFVGWWLLQPPNGPDQPKVTGEAELGYRLLRRHWRRRHWRRGYASEGARELIRYGFADQGLDRVFAQAMAANAASCATMQAVGLTFARAFLSDEPYLESIPDSNLGEVEYEITRARWRNQHSPSDTRACT